MEQLTLTNEGYVEIKKKIRDELNKQMNSFIATGYYLKQIRDSGAYLQDGYKNMEEFAMGEYRISGSTASRYMDINTAFSKDGNSLEVKPEYGKYGYSKLQEMLTVSPEDWSLITDKTTVKEIREIKKFEKEEEKVQQENEQKNLPLMQIAAPLESDATSQERPGVTMKDLFVAFWETNHEILAMVINNMISEEDLSEELCPSGCRTFWHDIYMIFFYSKEAGIKIRYSENGQAKIDSLSYMDFMEKTREYIGENEIESILHHGKTESVAETVPEKEEQAVEDTEQTETVDEEPVEESETAAEHTEAYDKAAVHEVLEGQLTTEDIPELCTGMVIDTGRPDMEIKDSSTVEERLETMISLLEDETSLEESEQRSFSAREVLNMLIEIKLGEVIKEV